MEYGEERPVPRRHHERGIYVLPVHQAAPPSDLGDVEAIQAKITEITVGARA